MDIICTVEGQRLKIVTPIKHYAQGSDDFVRFLFTLSGDWDGLVTFAQFRQQNKVYNEYFVSATVDGKHYRSCTLPGGLQPGPVTMTLYGTAPEKVIGTTNYVLMMIDATGFVSDAESTDVSESLYQQLVNRMIQLEYRYDIVQDYEGAWQAVLAAIDGSQAWEERDVKHGDTPPASPSDGDYWYCDNTGATYTAGLYKYVASTTTWTALTNTATGTTVPPSVYYWYDTAHAKLYQTPLMAVPIATKSTAGGFKLGSNEFSIGTGSAAGQLKLSERYKKHNSYNLIEAHTGVNGAHNGVTFTWDGDYEECNANGTADGLARSVIAGGTGAMPEGMEAGKTYIFRFTTTDTNLRMGLFYYTADGYAGQIGTNASGDTRITIPATATVDGVTGAVVGVMLMVYVHDGSTVTNAKISKLQILNAYTNTDLQTNLVKEVRGAVDDMLITIPGEILKPETFKSLTVSKVSFAWDSATHTYVVVATGATTSDEAVLLYKTEDDDPYIRMTPGKKYRVKYHTTNKEVKLAISLYKKSDNTLATTIAAYGNTDITIPKEVNSAEINHCHVSLYVASGKNISGSSVTVSNLSIIQLPEEDEDIMHEITYTRDSSGKQLISKEPSFTWEPNPNPNHLGMTYTWNADGSCSVSGNCGSYVATQQLFTAWGASVMPPSMAQGGKYYIDYETTDPRIQLYILVYKSGSTDNPYAFTFVESGVLEIPDDNNITGMSIRLRARPGVYSGTVKRLRIFTSDCMDVIKGAVNYKEPVKMRLMQFNVGKWNYGDVSNPGYRGDDMDTKIVNYVRMLSKYQPDIIGMEEFLEYFDADQSKKADTYIFDGLFPEKHNWLTEQRSIKSKFKIASAEQKSFTAYAADGVTPITETVDGVTRNVTTPCIICDVIAYGRRLKCAVIALRSAQSTTFQQVRKSTLAQLLDYITFEDFAFVILDMNNNGASGSATFDDSVAEAEALITDVIAPKGFKTVNSSYNGWEATYDGSSVTWKPSIDNIIYKNNGRTLFNGFQVLSGEHENLTSDHHAVFADFILK